MQAEQIARIVWAADNAFDNVLGNTEIRKWTDLNTTEQAYQAKSVQEEMVAIITGAYTPIINMPQIIIDRTKLRANIISTFITHAS